MRTPYNIHRWDYGNWNRTLDDQRRWGFWGGRGDMNAMRARSEQMMQGMSQQGGGGRGVDWGLFGGMFLPDTGGVPPAYRWQRAIMEWQKKRQMATQGINSPQEFYNLLFQKLDPYLIKAIKNMVMLLPYGAPQAELDATTGQIREQALIGATDLAQMARAQYGSGAGSIARPSAMAMVGQAERMAGQAEAEARAAAQQRPLQVFQILMSLLQPEVLASLNAEKAGIDYARRQQQRQLWQSIAQGIISGGFG